MSLRLEMLQVARLSPKVLEEATSLVRSFLHGQLLESGGFKNREGKSDLYYTVFGVDALLSLNAEVPEEQIRAYLESFGDGEGLDFVHLCCLARLCGALSISRKGILPRIEKYRTSDGGYHPKIGVESSSAYGCFLAYGAYGDLKVELENESGLRECLKQFQCEDGGFANEKDIQQGTTTATAAVITLLRNLEVKVEKSTLDWLCHRVHPMGGFPAGPLTPMPDLLSTAVALHALSNEQAFLNKIREDCLDFVDSLWENSGGFYGHWADEALDSEYTFYGLLALGHLSL